MKIEIQRVTSWTDVLNAARFTQRKLVNGFVGYCMIKMTKGNE